MEIPTYATEGLGTDAGSFIGEWSTTTTIAAGQHMAIQPSEPLSLRACSLPNPRMSARTLKTQPGR